MAIGVAYTISVILTYSGVFKDDPTAAFYKARVDSRISVLNNAKWFRFPYPGKSMRIKHGIAGRIRWSR